MGKTLGIATLITLFIILPVGFFLDHLGLHPGITAGVAMLFGMIAIFSVPPE